MELSNVNFKKLVNDVGEEVDVKDIWAVPETVAYLGTLSSPDGQPIVIDAIADEGQTVLLMVIDGTVETDSYIHVKASQLK